MSKPALQVMEQEQRSDELELGAPTPPVAKDVPSSDSHNDSQPKISKLYVTDRPSSFCQEGY